MCIRFVYTYLINPSEKRLIKRFQLFSDINYEDDSFQSVDLCCYYMQWTRIDFSNTGRYAAVRVRGDYNPQEGDWHHKNRCSRGS